MSRACRKSKNLRGISVIQLIGIILVISSLVYMSYSHFRVVMRKNAIESAKEEFIKNGLAGNKPSTKNTKKPSDKSKRIGKNLEKPQKSGLNQSAQKQMLKNAIAYIEIKKINLVLPIFDNTSNLALRAGVGILEETDHLSKDKNTVTVLAGHRGGYNGEDTFLHIDRLDPGDEILITTHEEILKYRVENKEIIEPTDWSKFDKQEDKTRLILMSCHPYPTNTYRLLVKAVLDSSESLR